ncbi:unnamed protein product [Albugo candida]|uniref:Uncharacterized protein n=1 Tax=Albugo candida TaxID=65357 RepID=A0A024GQ73_9STRA|nr:unnamed protein product [Albugo candida]|eukprot:CCI49039.1 unnamed protein product [Albugo candida]
MGYLNKMKHTRYIRKTTSSARTQTILMDVTSSTIEAFPWIKHIFCVVSFLSQDTLFWQLCIGMLYTFVHQSISIMRELVSSHSFGCQALVQQDCISFSFIEWELTSHLSSRQLTSQNRTCHVVDGEISPDSRSIMHSTLSTSSGSAL